MSEETRRRELIRTIMGLIAAEHRRHAARVGGLNMALDQLATDADAELIGDLYLELMVAPDPDQAAAGKRIRDHLESVEWPEPCGDCPTCGDKHGFDECPQCRQDVAIDCQGKEMPETCGA